MDLKVGLIGLTHPHSLAHLHTLELMDDVKSIFVFDEDAAARAQVRGRPRVAAVFDDLDDLLRRDDVPVILVARRNDESVPTMLRAVAAGKHVISDKPAARTAEELEPLLEAAARRSVLVGVCYQNRWRPDLRQLQRLREEGALGRLLSVEFRLMTTAVSLRDPRSWLFRKAAAGGGILHWLGCHYVDLLRYLTGEEVTAVSAVVRTLSREAIDVEDVAVVSFILSGGAVATLHTGYVLAAGQPGYLNPGYETYVGLRGTLGQAWTDSGPGDLSLALESIAPGWRHARRHNFSYALPQSEAYAGVHGMDFLRAFFQAALEGGNPPVTGEDALKVLQIIGAAYRSSENGCVWPVHTAALERR